MRRRYIDWARAVAILVMVEAHTLDAWTKLSLRRSHAFRNLTVVGGFAAPLFLWLAGLALVLSAERTRERTGSARKATEAVCRRGLEVFILAFLFRIQAFIVSPGSSPITLFRVDILNIMGPAMVVAALVWGVFRGATSRTIAFATLATLTTTVTPVVRDARWVGVLPVWLQWYITPTADYTTFTLFPWAGFLFAGAAVGVVTIAVRGMRAERRLQAVLGLAGAALIALGFAMAARPSIYAQSSFWTSSPTFFAIRSGVLLMALPILYFGESFLSRRGIFLGWLEKFGRSSLFVYWIHVELVYGYATWPIRRHLSLWQMAAAYTVFVTALYGAILLRDRAVAAWRGRREAGRPIEAAPA